jgi:hypothetical protein
MKWFRHLKRGTEYGVIAKARLQCATPHQEGDLLVIYIDKQGSVWARPATEFHDGRFVPSENSFPLILTDMEALPNSSVQNVLTEVGTEVISAEAAWPQLNSAHEAYGVILEELDEVWEHVKTKQSKRDLPAMRKELIQTAAMAIRFIRDVIDGGRGRR